MQEGATREGNGCKRKVRAVFVRSQDGFKFEIEGVLGGRYFLTPSKASLRCGFRIRV